MHVSFDSPLRVDGRGCLKLSTVGVQKSPDDLPAGSGLQTPSGTPPEGPKAGLQSLQRGGLDWELRRGRGAVIGPKVQNHGSALVRRVARPGKACQCRAG